MKADWLVMEYHSVLHPLRDGGWAIGSPSPLHLRLVLVTVIPLFRTVINSAP